ncbi:MAG: hypothetical protein ACTHOH_11895 [Lysobacteraceae bacterium]
MCPVAAPAATPVPPLRACPPPLAALLALALALGAVGCGDRERERAPHVGASDPVQAVALLNADLRDNDLAGFARDAVPPSLHAPLAAAWRAGRTRWPLEELPFDQRIPGVLASLSADDAEKRLRKGYDRQFARADGEIRAASQALGLFGEKYLQSEAGLSAEERTHYVQLVRAITAWAGRAGLGDARRGHAAIPKLVLAARGTGLHDAADFRRLGMDESLRRLGPMAAALKDVLRGYGLDLDASLDAMALSLESRDGDHARVRMRYPLASATIDTVVAVEQVDGHWYLSDFLRHARAAAAVADAPASPAVGVAPGTAPPATTTP